MVLISKFEPRNRRKLFFQEITVTFLKDFEAFLDDRPRAQSLYIRQMRHIFREAMLEYNTDDEIVIKNDPFLRYKAPKQVLKKGVRALSLDQLMKVVNYEIADVYITKDFSIINDNNFKLLDKVFKNQIPTL